MSPPQLTGNTPWLNVFHPVEVGLFPILRHDLCASITNRSHGWLCEFGCVHIPLVSQIWLDWHTTAIAVRDSVGVILDLFQITLLVKHFAEALACSKTIQTFELFDKRYQIRCQFQTFEEINIVLERNRCRRRQNIDCTKIVALANFKVVEVVRRCDLHSTGTGFRVSIIVRDNRYAASNERKNDVVADRRVIALVLRVNSNTRITKHGFRTCRCNNDEGMRVFWIERNVFQRIAQMPEIALNLT